MRVSVLFLVLAPCLAVAGEGGTGTISGTIQPPVTMRIVAKVSGTEWQRSENVKGEATPDDRGKWAIRDLPAGTYDLIFVLGRGDAGRWHVSNWFGISVVPGSTSEGHDVRLTPAGADHLVDEVLVAFPKDLVLADVVAIISRSGCRMKAAPIALGEEIIYVLDLPGDRSVAEAVQEFAAIPGVLRAEPNGITTVDMDTE